MVFEIYFWHVWVSEKHNDRVHAVDYIILFPKIDLGISYHMTARKSQNFHEILDSFQNAIRQRSTDCEIWSYKQLHADPSCSKYIFDMFVSLKNIMIECMQSIETFYYPKTTWAFITIWHHENHRNFQEMVFWAECYPTKVNRLRYIKL